MKIIKKLYGEDKIYRFEYYFDKDGNLVFEKVDNFSK